MIYNLLKNANITFTNNVPNGISFIMEDGKFLDVESSKDVILDQEQNYEIGHKINHSTFENYLYRVGLINKTDIKSLVLTDNAIAINDGSNYACEAAYFNLPQNEPTTAQYNSLADWLTQLCGKCDIVQLEERRKKMIKVYRLISLENEQAYTPEEIIQDIKRMYAEAN